MKFVNSLFLGVLVLSLFSGFSLAQTSSCTALPNEFAYKTSMQVGQTVAFPSGAKAFLRTIYNGVNSNGVLVGYVKVDLYDPTGLLFDSIVLSDGVGVVNDKVGYSIKLCTAQTGVAPIASIRFGSTDVCVKQSNEFVFNKFMHPGEFVTASNGYKIALYGLSQSPGTIGYLGRAEVYNAAGVKMDSFPLGPTGTTSYTSQGFTVRICGTTSKFASVGVSNAGVTPTPTIGVTPTPTLNATQTVNATNSTNSTPTPTPYPSNAGVYQIHLKPGWNLVSSPINLGGVTGSCLPLTAFNYKNGAYVSAVLSQNTNAFGFGKGYWLKSPSECTLTLSGVIATGSSFQMTSGWNQIGVPLGGPFPWNQIKGNCVLQSSIWAFENGDWMRASTLQPGKGYFVKLASACTINFNSDLPPLPNGG